MVEVSFYINLQIAIVGLGLPILLQVVSRLDNKYKSTSILSLFLTEKALYFFLLALGLSICSAIIWSFNMTPFFSVKIEWVKFLLENSADLLVTFFSIILLISFLWIYYTVFIYYTYEQLVPHLLKSTNNIERRDEALRDIFLFLLVTKGKESLLVKLKEHYDQLFAQKRHRDNSQPKQYTPLLSDLVLKVSQVQNSENANLSQYYSQINLSSQWLISDFVMYQLSPLAYRDTWIVLGKSIEHNNAELFMDHWRRADKIISHLNIEISSLYYKDEVDMAETIMKKKLKFVRFHFSLGGLILYKKRYQIIGRIFKHTTSDPSQYYMLPKNMTEIFEFYRLTRERIPIDYDETFLYFLFPGTDGLRAESTSIKWISTYTSLLFVRQFTLESYTHGYEPLDFPILPQSQREIKVWKESLPFFKTLTLEVLDNSELLETLGFNLYPKINEKSDVVIYLDDLQNHIDERFCQMKITEPLSSQKIELFTNTSNTVINTGLDRLFENLSKPKEEKAAAAETDAEAAEEEEEEASYEISTIIGTTKHYLEKDAFIKESLVHHTNFDSFTAGSAIHEIEQQIQQHFYDNCNHYVSIKSINLKEAFDTLDINENHVIVNFGHDLNYHLLDNQTGEVEERFKNLDIREFYSHNNNQKGIYILNRVDLPSLITKDLNDKAKEELELLDETYYAYWKVNEPEANNETNCHELIVEVGIYIEITMKSKSEFNMIFIRINKDYDLSGEEVDPSTLSDLKI